MDFSGNSGNTAIIIFVIFLSGVLMFVFPLMIVANQQDKVVEVKAQEIITDFTDSARTLGGFDQEDYDNLVLTLASTGRAYKIYITLYLRDGNPAKKLATVQVGDDIYYIMYTTQVNEVLASQGAIDLNNGDAIYVSCEPVDISIGDQIINSIYKAVGITTSRLSAGGLVGQ